MYQVLYRQYSKKTKQKKNSSQYEYVVISQCGALLIVAIDIMVVRRRVTRKTAHHSLG